MINYDIIGDVHGCLDELNELMGLLGYDRNGQYKNRSSNRQLIFVGDLVDRGPSSDGVLELLINLYDQRLVTVLLGNHDEKLRKYLHRGEQSMRAGQMLTATLAQLEPRGEAFLGRVKDFLEQLPYRFADGDLLVVHGAVLPTDRENLDQLTDKQLKSEKAWALYGQVAGITADGFPIRLQDWARTYSGPYSTIVRGHSVVDDVETIVSLSGARIVNVDTGCAYGGMLSALRYPEHSVVQVKAHKTYYQGSVCE